MKFDFQFRGIKRPDLRFIKRLLRIEQAREAADPVEELMEIQRRLAANVLRVSTVRDQLEEIALESHRIGLIAQRLQSWLYEREKQ